jgi:hypothetical protein
MVMDKLSIQNEMACVDKKNRKFYDDLTVEERKKFSNFLMIRWTSGVQGPSELQEYYVQSCNHYLNQHFFDINRHPKLQWLCATAVSPGLGIQRHQWIAPKKKEPGITGIRKQLIELFPLLKDDEIELMLKLNSKKDIDAYVKQLGQDTK